MCEEVAPEDTAEGDVLISRNGKLVRPKRLPSGSGTQFRQGTGNERCVFDCIEANQCWLLTCCGSKTATTKRC